MKKISKFNAGIVSPIYILLLMLLVACGGNTTDKAIFAPEGSKLTVNPTSSAFTGLTGTVRQDVVVYLNDKDGIPLHGKTITVSASFAAPYTPFLYQMYDKNTNAPMLSPFNARINDYGIYEFYLLIPATSYFDPDNLNITSGAATPASMTLSNTP